MRRVQQGPNLNAAWMRRDRFVALVAGCGLSLAELGLSMSAAEAQGAPPPAVRPAIASPAADTTTAGASYITPFPPNDVYKLQVYGDGFVEGLSQGLIESLRPDTRVDIARKPRSIGTLIRSEYDDELKIEEQSRETFHIGVVMLGLNDRGALRTSGSSALKFGTPQWKDQYGQRVDRIFKALKRREMALYVVGLPPLRRQDANGDLELVNEVLVERAFANGIRLIEVTESFTDENGAFSQFGPDSAGNREKLRDGDGIGFTPGGYRKLAGLVVTEIKRDLAAARGERAVPLAGSEIEQQRINPDKAGATVTPILPKTGSAKDGREPRPAALPAGAAAAGTPSATRAAAASGDQKAETTKVGLRLPGISGRTDLTQVEIVRPAISAAVIALLTRKETVDAVQQPFELLADDVGDGVSVSTMVTAMVDAQSTSGRRKGPTNQAAYTSVWIKGERLPAKPGRADDFSWPRPGAELAAIAPQGAAVPSVTGNQTTATARKKVIEPGVAPSAGVDRQPRARQNQR